MADRDIGEEMNGPNPVLTYYYGNEKVAGLGSAVYSMLLQQMMSHDTEKQEQEAQRLNEIAQEVEHERIRPAIEALRYTPVDPGMVRLASVAAYAGVDMAKRAGIIGGTIGALAKSPTARKAIGLGAIAGGGVLAAKAINKVPQELGREAGPQSWNSGRFGYNPAFGVNQYGQPQAGTPLM
jgi:hypothetical protein